MAEVGRFGLGATVLRAGLSLLWAVVLLAPQALWAQSSALQFDEQASPLRCLQPAESELPPLAYPPEALVRKIEGLVRVRLTFKDATSPPDVEVFHVSGFAEFAQLVKQRVAVYRLPCLKAGQGPVVATQEFRFSPDDGRKVSWGATRDVDIDRRLNACTERDPSAPKNISYPQTAANKNQSGVVVARMTFVAADAPPKVEILTDAGSRSLAARVTQYVEGFRLPCLSPEDFPLTTWQAYKFMISDVPGFTLKDVNLVQFLRAVEGFEDQKVNFNFDTMGCPFDVRLRLFQPYMKNEVGEVGERDPNRVEFIEWLKNVSLALPKERMRHVLSDTMTISVPCGVLSLP